jgi:carbamoyltransferase
MKAIPVWIKEKLFLKKLIRDQLHEIGLKQFRLIFPEHHLSHAASAFYPSPYNEAAILTIDGVGEWATATIGHGKGNTITMLRELQFPHSVGLLYSAFTYYTGFRVNSGEYKLMGLAPFGDVNSERYNAIKEKILTTLVDIREDGSILLNMKYFDFATGLKMTNDKKWLQLFGFPPRQPESPIAQEYMDMALAIQHVTEVIVMKMAVTAKELTQCKNLVMAGGVALNSVANGKILKSGLFDGLWIQPASGDAGGAVGAALAGHYIFRGEESGEWRVERGEWREENGEMDGMKGALLGPEYSDREIARVASKYNDEGTFFGDFDELARLTAQLIADGKVVGWFQGRMEFGPRALGNRSILGDPRNPEMQRKLNLKIKFREGFRPFAPTILEEDIQSCFECDRPSPYMLLVVPVNENRRISLPEGFNLKNLNERLNTIRSDVPAITHVDYSARIQSVNKKTNPKYWTLINEFKKLTGCPLIVNTSFNVRGEPIVCTPEDAYRCFMKTGMDVLVMGNYFFIKDQ